MSDTKHKPSGAVGRQYHLAVVEKKDKEIAALRAAAEKARNRWIGYETALEEILKLEKSLGTAFSWIELREYKEATRKIALAALEEVLK